MKNDKKEHILDTMEKLMMLMPNEEISVNMIAEEANIAKGGIYYYFKSKDEILYAVVDRCYKRAVHEYFSGIQSKAPAIEKIKILFQSILKKTFHDNQINLIHALHLNEDTILHNKMKIVAIQEVSPILTELLIEGVKEGSIKTDTPKESAEMIVSVLTFFLDNTIFQSDKEGIYKKLQILAKVFEVSLHVEKGGFDFLYNIETYI